MDVSLVLMGCILPREMANLRPMKAVLVVINAMKETLGCGAENKGGQGGKERHV